MKVTCKSRSCNNVFDIIDDKLGNKVICPKCNYHFTVLAPSTYDEIAIHNKRQHQIQVAENKICKTSKIKNITDYTGCVDLLKNKGTTLEIIGSVSFKEKRLRDRVRTACLREDRAA